MSIPNRPGSRAENLYGNMIGQETATPPTNPQSRIEDYLDYILNNGTQLEQEIKDDVDALKGIGRYLSLWDCTTGKPTTDPKKLPYKYKSGDYYIVSAVGATNYMPSGTQYEGIASSTTDSGVSVNDFYLFDGTTWSRMAHSSVESVFVANYTKTNNVWSCDKTFAEIKAEYDAGKLCLANFGLQSQNVGYIHGITDSRIDWLSAYIDGDRHGSIKRQHFYHDNDNTFQIIFEYSNVLPAITTSDNGKVIGISNGQWNKIDPPTELPAVTASDNGKVLGVSNGSWDKVDTKLQRCDIDTIHPSLNYGETTGWSSADAARVIELLRSGLPYEIYVDGYIAFVKSYSLTAGREYVLIVVDDGTFEWYDDDPWSSLEIKHVTGRLNLSARYEGSLCTTDVSVDSQNPVPIGGDQGQVLKKTGDSYDEYDWRNINEIPSGGTTGQVLKKASNTNYDVVWANESGGGSSGIMVVKYTYDYNEYVEVCDHTYQDILQAILHGTPIVGSYADPDMQFNLYVATIDGGNNNTIELVGFLPGFGDHIRVILNHRSDESFSLDFCVDRPLEFSVDCVTGAGITDMILSCDLDLEFPVAYWYYFTAQSGVSIQRSLCANVTFSDYDPVTGDTIRYGHPARYYVLYAVHEGDIYTFHCLADDGAPFVFEADVSDPTNITYFVGGHDSIVNSIIVRYGFNGWRYISSFGAFCGYVKPDNSGRLFGQPIVCFDSYPATQKFLVAAMSSIGTDVTITYDTTDDQDFSLDIGFVQMPWIVVPTVDESTYDGTQNSLYLTRKFYITGYMSEYLEAKFPFDYNGTMFIIDIKNLNITGTGTSAVITITGNATLM